MTSDIVHRNGDALSGVASLFFETVKNEQDEPELNNDYPYAYVVELGDQTFIGFDTNLPREREPWSVRGLSFDRDTVFQANKRSLEPVSGDMQLVVNKLLNVLA